MDTACLPLEFFDFLVSGQFIPDVALGDILGMEGSVIAWWVADLSSAWITVDDCTFGWVDGTQIGRATASTMRTEGPVSDAVRVPAMGAETEGGIINRHGTLRLA